jgi:hypothetical protein
MNDASPRLVRFASLTRDENDVRAERLAKDYADDFMRAVQALLDAPADPFLADATAILESLLKTCPNDEERRLDVLERACVRLCGGDVVRGRQLARDAIYNVGAE